MSFENKPAAWYNPNKTFLILNIGQLFLIVEYMTTSPQTLIEIRVILTFGEQMSLYKNIYMVSLLQMSFQIEKE